MVFKKFIMTLVFILLFWCAYGFAFEPQVQNPVDPSGYRFLNVAKISGKIDIDGALDESEWQNANFQDNFLQREPHYGNPASERTEIALLKDSKNLYIGIKCYDSDPSRIIANEMRRDANVDQDDNFEFILDTFRDHRNGYYFILNANGVKRDATMGEEGRAFNPDWDGIWELSTEINDQGWFAEIAIPWKTLRFEAGKDSIWGANFARSIRHKNEHVYWQLVTRNAGNGGLFRVSQAGSLHGLRDMQAGGNLDIHPYLLGGLSRDAEASSTYDKVGEVGLDATVALTSNLNLKISLNTDFAQVESDQALVNLTRFSLYFPEKRDFFLDGAEIFSFGNSRMGHAGSDDLNLFYSRRIGIIEGNQQRILGGVKLLGKVGDYQIGFLNMHTEPVSAYDENEDETTDYPASNFSAFRIKRDIFSRSTIGLMLLNKEDMKSPHYNRTAGIDARFPLSESFTLSGDIATTIEPSAPKPGSENKNLAGSATMDYNSDLWGFNLTHLNIQENFNPEMGFIRRADIRKTSGGIEYAPRPDNWPTIRQLFYKLNYVYVTDQANRLMESETGASFTISFQNSAKYTFLVNRETEILDDDWEVRDGLIIPAGRYDGWESSMVLSTDESRDISTLIEASYEDYYTGTRLFIGPGLKLKNFKRIRTDLDFGYHHVELPDGNFDIRTAGCHFYYFFSTRIYIKAYLQWNDDQRANAGDRIALSNILLRWIYKPGSDIYLVFNEGWKLGDTGNRMTNRSVLLKWTYFWRN